ncbi:hypothetical protein ADUPG1_006909, partial [Aduncisulcus paluster]
KVEDLKAQLFAEGVSDLAEKVSDSITGDCVDILPGVVIGDFNCLSQRDYTPVQWRDIRRVRSVGNWECPRSAVASWLESAGYRDSLYYCVESKEGEMKDARTPGKVSHTSRFHTRIDYAFLCPCSASIDVVRYEVSYPPASDHAVVSISLDITADHKRE